MKTNFKKSNSNFGCYAENGNKQNNFIKTEDFSIDDVLNADVSIRDKFWFIHNNCALNSKEYREMAIGFALIVLPIYEVEHSNNKAPREAIDAAKAYLAGAISINELKIKSFDAITAADAATAAAYSAATAAAYSAVAAAAAYSAVVAADAAVAAADAAAAADTAGYANIYKTQILIFLKSFLYANN